MKKIYILASLISAFYLAACSNSSVDESAKSAEALSQEIIGSWISLKPVTLNQGGLTMEYPEGKIEYFANGRAKSYTIAEIKGGGIPKNMSRYTITIGSTWDIKKGVVHENVTELSVKPASSSTLAKKIAQTMQKEMQKVRTTQSEIVKLDDKNLELREERSKMVLHYKRQ